MNELYLITAIAGGVVGLLVVGWGLVRFIGRVAIWINSVDELTKTVKADTIGRQANTAALQQLAERVDELNQRVSHLESRV